MQHLIREGYRRIVEGIKENSMSGKKRLRLTETVSGAG
jgi:hypothetical protein